MPLRLLFLGVLYALAYDYVYREFVDCFFPLNRESYHSMSGFAFLYYMLLASIPFVFYRGLKTVAASFSFFTYILAYIPILNALFSYSFSETIQLEYSLTLFVCMCVFFATDRMYLLKYLFAKRKKLISFRVLEYFVLICMVLLILLNLSQLTFVNFLEKGSELYEARADNNLKGVYFIGWMRSCFLPLIMVKSLCESNFRKYVFAFVAFIIIFMMDKQKITAVFPLVLTGLYYVARKDNNVFSTYFHAIIIMFIIFVSFSMVAYISYTDTTLMSNPIIFSIAALFVMRTQCIEGMEAVRYFSFFVNQDNPFTYYGHVKVINALTNIYPYSESVGETVAGDGGVSNATFWLMDGVAAMGIIGVIIISILFVVFKSIMN